MRRCLKPRRRLLLATPDVRQSCPLPLQDAEGLAGVAWRGQQGPPGLSVGGPSVGSLVGLDMDGVSNPFRPCMLMSRRLLAELLLQQLTDRLQKVREGGLVDVRDGESRQFVHDQRLSELLGSRVQLDERWHRSELSVRLLQRVSEVERGGDVRVAAVDVPQRRLYPTLKPVQRSYEGRPRLNMSSAPFSRLDLLDPRRSSSVGPTLHRDVEEQAQRFLEEEREGAVALVQDLGLLAL